MERGLLSDKKLAPFYDQVEWLYLFQDFSGSEADRRAQRIAIRFGISSWPQHFLVDPYTLESLGSTGRSLESFGKAVKKAKVTLLYNSDRLKSLDAEAAALEGLSDSKEDNAKAAKALEHEDIVVRYRALEHLVKHDPKAVIEAAPMLLKTPNDQVRYKVCALLAKHGPSEDQTKETRDVLSILVEVTPGSKNPNVLRIRAIQALAKCGNAGSVNEIVEYAATGAYNNGLTGVALTVTLELCEKFPKQKASAAKALKAGFPALPEMDPKSKYYARRMRSCRALAKKINAALEKLSGKKVAFPEAYDAETRKALIKAWE